MLEKLVAGWFVINLIAIGGYDLVIMFFFPDHNSVSYILYQWGKAYPSLYLLIGIMLGHLIFPLKITLDGKL